MATLERATRLCLAVTADAGPAAGERLSAALGVGDIASVLIAGGPSRPLVAATARPLVELAQRAGAAALLVDDARLARTIKADGVHLSAGSTPLADYREAREILGGGAIVGIDAGSSHHDAMELAEAGADYIAFGVAAGDPRTALEHRLGLVAWWAEIFQPPCVALDVASLDEAAALVRAGADFIVVTIAEGRTAGDVRDLASAHARAIDMRASAQ